MKYLLVATILLGAVFCSLNEQEVTHRLEFQVSIDGKDAGSYEIGLFGKVVPKTVENFKSLCTGERGVSSSGQQLSYVGSKFHRIIPGFMIQGGDFTKGDGTGGESIYGSRFDDENFVLKHDKFCLSMANAGKNTNGSQFFITTAQTPWLDGRHVVFGRITRNTELIEKIEKVGTQSGTPQKQVQITGCKLL